VNIKKLPEHFLQYVWQHKRFDFSQLKTVDGRKVLLVDTGTHNTNAGADFLLAKIYLDDVLWVGDVEIHWRSSQWYTHRHEKDPAYNSVILHVVAQYNSITYNQKGEELPVLVIPPALIEADLLSKYAYLSAEKQFIPCYQHFAQYASAVMPDFLPILTQERLTAKANFILNELETSKNDWAQVFYQQLSLFLSANINGEAMLALAKSLPFILLQKYKSNLYQLEALLLGQSGLLPAESKDAYLQKLINEYDFLSKKHDLSPLSAQLWKFSRMRPANFPTIRIAQLAQLIFQTEHLWASLLAIDDYRDYEPFFEVQLHSFWDDKYRLEKTKTVSPKRMGKTAVHHLLINTVAPFLYACGQAMQTPVYKQKAIDLLQNLPAEDNPVLEEWEKLGQKASDAKDSQALLQLKKCYCEQLNCVNCPIGKRFLFE
jgi:Protein of unknown function (DUF2851)